MTTATAAPARFAPSVLDPADVALVAAWDSNPEESLYRPHAEDRRFYVERLAPEARERGGLSRCTICGAWLRYVVVACLVSTGEFFVVGDDCAANLELAAEIGVKVTALRASSAAQRDNLKRAAAAESVLARDSALGAFFALPGDFPDDLFASLYRYGSLTDRQRAAAARYVDGWAEREEKRLAREARDAAAPAPAPVVEGRIEITGEVLTVKVVDGYAYGSTVLKVLVRDDRGFKVWGTLPSALSDVENGARVAFTAAVEASKDDETFGFFKRPTKARLA